MTYFVFSPLFPLAVLKIYLCRNKRLPELIEQRGFGNAIPLTVSDAGLEGIPEGLDTLRAGKVSGGKLAYRF